MTRSLFLLLVAFLFTSLAGCGGDVQKVERTIKLVDGTPLTKGTIMFDSETTNVIGSIGENGRFVLYQFKPGDGVPYGKYRGAISYPVPEQTNMHLSLEESLKKGLPFSPKYASVETSGLTLTVEAGKPVKMDIVLAE